MTTPHDVLKEHDITPTADAERAYRLGCELGYELGVQDAKRDMGPERELRSERDKLGQKVARLEQILTEIGLLSRRAR